MNKMNTKETLNRMKSLMSYGLQTEGKKTPYSTVEYQKKGADGNVYGIVREGTKYYIKSAPNKANLVKEDFNYIGGFRNRKENEYTNYANAQKQFDLKMMSLKEAYNNPSFKVESWNLDKKETVVTEASEKMQKEILRERQIMKNAAVISEKKGAICCDTPKTPSDNIKGGKPETGSPNVGSPFTEKSDICPECGSAECKCGGKKKKTNESSEVLGWNRNSDDYMDKSHGTEIGDSAPFDDATARNIDDQDKKVSKTGELKNGVVENHGTSMHDADNQNSPAVGVGEGPSDDNNNPFNDKKGKQIDEAVDDIADDDDDDLEMGDEDMEGFDDEGLDDGGLNDEELDGEGLDDEGFNDEELDGEGLDDDGLDDEELDGEGLDDDIYEDDLESRMDAVEELLASIADKLGVSEPPVDEDNYEDDELFDGEGDLDDNEDGLDDDYDDEEPMKDETDMDMPMEGKRRKGVQIIETKGFKRAMRRRMMNEGGMTPFSDKGRVPAGNMNKLDDFGKHPAYQKKVMSLPPKDMAEFPGYYDMNDDSVRNDNPYGEKIGDGAPFDINVDAIDNAIAEAFVRLKKKGNRR